MVGPLRDSRIEARAGESLIAPVEIHGLPPEIEALGRRWQRKVEFHMTVVGAAVIEATGVEWESVAGLVAGQRVGPICVTRELRRVRHPDKPDLETIVVMVTCPALVPLFEQLSEKLRVSLDPPPAHVTLYSTDPGQGIGINDEQELRERALELSWADQAELRRAMGFDVVFGTET